MSVFWVLLTLTLKTSYLDVPKEGWGGRIDDDAMTLLGGFSLARSLALRSAHDMTRGGQETAEDRSTTPIMQSRCR